MCLVSITMQYNNHDAEFVSFDGTEEMLERKLYGIQPEHRAPPVSLFRPEYISPPQYYRAMRHIKVRDMEPDNVDKPLDLIKETRLARAMRRASALMWW